jgi:hypothetical protein
MWVRAKAVEILNPESDVVICNTEYFKIFLLHPLTIFLTCS